jgi:hypothetical protein
VPNADGIGWEQVTRSGTFTAFPEFSPDGKSIFVSDQDARTPNKFNALAAPWRTAFTTEACPALGTLGPGNWKKNPA